MGATLNRLLFYVCATFSIIHLAHSQNQQGFISLDCGLPSNESPYNEPFTNLTYISDAGFVHSGKTGTIHKDLKTHFMKPYTGLRYFPDGIRNCYNLSVMQDTKYLIRTVFVYGNYDGLNASPRFDLYLGPNIWRTVDAKLSGPGTAQEIIHITRSNILEICLVKTGTSTPLISALELRPLPYDTYITRTGSLKYVDRIYFSNSEKGVRYPEDVYDRAWSSVLPVEWTQINTTLDVVDSHKDYNPPQDVIKTAAVPANDSEPMTFSWTLDTSDDETYAYLYMADIQKMRNNDTREFDIIANGKVEFNPYSPMKFEVEVLFNRVPLKCEGGLCRVQLSRTRKSTLPPLMNALEIFQVIEFPQSETNQDDVSAMKNIRDTYGLNKISWQGDPCVPKQFLWSGLRCNVIDVSTPPRIVALDLSSSGLSGDIPPVIQNLTQLQELDLSRNNLTGEVPEFLAKILKSLVVLNLSGNKFSGRIPQALLDREKEGLKLTLDGYLRTCKSCKKKFPMAAVVGASLSFVAIIIAVVVLVFIFKRKKPSTCKVKRPSLELKNRRFTYSEVKNMTNHFQVVLGKGGFGVVCQGFLNNQQVAVKVLSQSSTQGYKEFKTEVELLLRVHHVNLVSLIGYCDEGNDLALIYEFMENGNLKEHLSGERDGSVLNWRSRLKIAIESALGIEYLHIGCKPPMVHRDVKSTNILLGQHFEAKLADFGL
ncbi:probable LRR receptor-like serine/threonine-protein kinase At1g07550 [Raphanus sativus]|uniref:Probable LRR receptor-like serine/threonine-protein kinase At1g07550 n=1 Tax=Raphanus sativus TaxID=3726 RepID=A0A9W3DRX5_RAPSA|nr:probable LRR receptor-like serine/threonine-protein kinase At1g07550 [Raphanus sativus]